MYTSMLHDDTQRPIAFKMFICMFFHVSEHVAAGQTDYYDDVKGPSRFLLLMIHPEEGKTELS